MLTQTEEPFQGQVGCGSDTPRTAFAWLEESVCSHPGCVFVQLIKPGHTCGGLVECGLVTYLGWRNRRFVQQGPGIFLCGVCFSICLCRFSPGFQNKEEECEVILRNSMVWLCAWLFVSITIFSLSSGGYEVTICRLLVCYYSLSFILVIIKLLSFVGDLWHRLNKLILHMFTETF